MVVALATGQVEGRKEGGVPGPAMAAAAAAGEVKVTSDWGCLTFSRAMQPALEKAAWQVRIMLPLPDPGHVLTGLGFGVRFRVYIRLQVIHIQSFYTHCTATCADIKVIPLRTTIKMIMTMALFD
jgi:hypothetical protein